MDVDPRLVDCHVRNRILRERNPILIRYQTRCSGISLAAVTLGGIINFIDPSFTVTSWQTYLLYFAVAIITGKLVPPSSAFSMLTHTQRCLYLWPQNILHGSYKLHSCSRLLEWLCGSLFQWACINM